MEGVIKELQFNKKVLIESEGKVYESKGGFPGETVLFKNKRRKKANILEIVKSPYVKNTSCDVVDRCGGCRFREISYEDELKIKNDEMKRLFAPLEKRDGTEILEIHSPKKVLRYRNKMEYSFGNEEKDGPLKLGLHEKSMFYNIVEGADCLIVPKDMDTIRSEVKEFFLKRGETFYHKMTKDGFLRHLIVRHSVFYDEYMVNLVTTSIHPLDEEFKEFLLSLNDNLEGKITTIYHTINDSLSDAVVPEKLILLYGPGFLRERLFDLDFNVGPFSFFQTNSTAAEELYSYVKNHLKKTGVLWDLYAGSAVIGQVLSDMASEVISVEINPENVKDGEETIEENGIKNVKMVLADCKEFVKTTETKADTIIIDPPRAGIHKDVLQAIDESGVNQVIYVSCNPVTLKNDLMEMKNYKVLSVKGFNNFAGTLNIESVAILEKR